MCGWGCLEGAGWGSACSPAQQQAPARPRALGFANARRPPAPLGPKSRPRLHTSAPCFFGQLGCCHGGATPLTPPAPVCALPPFPRPRRARPSASPCSTTGRLCPATRWTGRSCCGRWSRRPCRWGRARTRLHVCLPAAAHLGRLPGPCLGSLRAGPGFQHMGWCSCSAFQHRTSVLRLPMCHTAWPGLAWLLAAKSSRRLYDTVPSRRLLCPLPRPPPGAGARLHGQDAAAQGHDRRREYALQGCAGHEASAQWPGA